MESQGRGPYEDESRIERHNQRPLENWPGDDDDDPPGGRRRGGPPPDNDGGGGPAFKRIIEEVRKNTDGVFAPSHRSTNMNAQNLADQLGWCITTRDQLQDLQADIRHVARQYYQTIEDLRGDQYLLELLNRLMPLCEEFSRRAEATVRHIDDAHIGYVNAQADAVSAQITVIMNLPKLGA